MIKTASDVVINPTAALEADEYEITIESYDALSPVGSTLKTDKIVIKIEERVIAPSLSQQLEIVELTPDEPKEWTLPEIDLGTYGLVSVKVTMPSSLTNVLKFDEDTQTFTFEGLSSSSSLAGQKFLI